MQFAIVRLLPLFILTFFTLYLLYVKYHPEIVKSKFRQYKGYPGKIASYKILYDNQTLNAAALFTLSTLLYSVIALFETFMGEIEPVLKFILSITSLASGLISFKLMSDVLKTLRKTP